MGDPYTMGPRVYFPFYCRWTNRDCFSKFFPRYCPSRHILRSSPLPLCPLNGGRLCYCCRLCSLIPSFYRIHPTRHMNKNSLRSNICRGKPNLLPTALPRTCWHAPTVLRLSRRIHFMKYNLFNWIFSFSCSSNHVPLYYLGSICRKT